MLYAYRKKLKQEAAEKVAAEAEGEEGGAEGEKEGPRGGREGGKKERYSSETKAPEGEEGPPATAGRPKSAKKGGGGGGGDGPAVEGAQSGDDGWGSFWLSPFGLGATGPSADPDKLGAGGEGANGGTDTKRTPKKTAKKTDPEQEIA